MGAIPCRSLPDPRLSFTKNIFKFNQEKYYKKNSLERRGTFSTLFRDSELERLIPPDLGVLQLLRDLPHGEVVQHGRGGRVVPRYPRTRSVQPRGVQRLVIRVLDVG